VLRGRLTRNTIEMQPVTRLAEASNQVPPHRLFVLVRDIIGYFHGIKPAYKLIWTNLLDT